MDALIRLILSLIPRYHTTRALLSRAVGLITINSTIAPEHGYGIITGKLTRQIKLLRRRTGKTTRLMNILNLNVRITPTMISLTLRTTTTGLTVRGIRTARRNQLATTQEPSRHHSLTLIGIRQHVIRNVIITVMRISILNKRRSLITRNPTTRTGTLLTLPRTQRGILDLKHNHLNYKHCVRLTRSTIVLLTDYSPAVQTAALGDDARVVDDTTIPRAVY